MMDGSLKADGKTPGDWDYNVGVTKTVTDMAHLGGISVEGELGVLGSLDTGEGVRAACRNGVLAADGMTWKGWTKSWEHTAPKADAKRDGCSSRSLVDVATAGLLAAAFSPKEGGPR